MNKTKMMLAVTGGVIGLAVLVMAYFTWEAFSAKAVALEGDEEEGTEGLETVLSRAQTLSRKGIYPCAASLKAIESNMTAVVEWQKEARNLAMRGDRVFAKTTPAAFKEFLVSDAKRLSAQPGTVGGVLVKPDFAFGPFKDYISGGKMPADAELADLQRRWDDVATVVEILAKSGIAELTDVGFAAAAGGEQGTGNREQEAKGKKNKKPVRKTNQTIKQSNNQTIQPVAFSYTFSFTTKPAAFVRALNAFVVSERFITVESFAMSRPKDAIAEALGGEEKTAAAATATSGRRRRRGAVVEAKKEDKADAKNGIVTDPLLDEPFAVVLTVNVRDFRSLEESKAEEVTK